MNKIAITCISENTSFHNSLLASHGQSLLVEIDDRKYLFDTTEIYEGLTYNMKSLDIHLEEIHTIVMSHNHLDHSGALFKLIDKLEKQKLFLPPDMMSLKEDTYSSNYRTTNKEEAINKLLHYQHTTVVNDAIQLEEHVFLTGPLEADVKEQSLILNIPNKGLVLVVGCSHPTLPVIVEKAREVTKTEKIYGIVGGLHYIFCNDKEIAENVAYLQSIDPEFVIPSHCSGYKAIRAMQDALGDKIQVSVTGQFGTGNSVTILPDFQFRDKKSALLHS